VNKKKKRRIKKLEVGARFIEPEELGSDKSDPYSKRRIVYALIVDKIVS